MTDLDKIQPQIDRLIPLLKEGNKRAAARLISYLEEYGHSVAQEIISQIFSITGNAYIIGITGSPGSGKSTLTNQLASYYLAEGKKVSVVCVDPTSPFSGGSILGDRIRMKENFSNPNLFIRSMAARGKLGGLAFKTKDVIHVLDAYGSDIILLETVGVGQSEVDVFRAAHTTLTVVNPGTGDEIQAIKAGIMEITDIFVVNKMDLPMADKKVKDLETMLYLNSFDSSLDHDASHNLIQGKESALHENIKSNKWIPPIVKTNAKDGINIDKLVKTIIDHDNFNDTQNLKTEHSINRYKYYIIDIIKHKISKDIENFVFTQPNISEKVNKLLEKEKNESPYSISKDLLEEIIDKL